MKWYVIGPGLADFGHGILSVLTVSLIFNIDPTPLIFVVGIIAAFSPDVDGVFEILKYKKIVADENHPKDHRDGAHYPLIWILFLAIVIYLNQYLGLIILVSVLMHFINDSWGTGWGVMWLWPFSSKSFKLFTDKNEDASTSHQNVVVSWTPEEKLEGIKKLGNPNWLHDCYGKVTTISVVEYGTFIFALLALVLFYVK